MKTRIKNLLLLLLLLGLPAVAQAQDAYSTNADGSIYTYSTNADGSANILAYAGPPWVVTIPTNINGLTVTTIGTNAFENNTNLTSVTIPNSVTSIGTNAFEVCTRLTSVTIPASVTNIGDAAFASCTSLTSIAVDASNPAYSSLGGVLFDKAQATLLQFPGGLGGSYTIPNSVTSIGGGAGEGAFESCTSLKSVTIGTNVTSIGFQAFFLCTSLTSVTIPDNVTNIGYRAFYACFDLTSVTIPSSVTSIGVEAFAFCTSLTSINVDASNPAYSSMNGVLFDKAQATLLQFPGGLGSYTIPASVITIGANAFENDTNLTSVTIPASVTSIGEEAFIGCQSLTDVRIPDSVTSIGDDAFYGCTSLTSVTIGNSVTSIGDDAFYGCTSLTSVTIGNSVTSIGVYAFEETALTSVTIPGSVTSIGDDAFASTRLTSVTIENGVTSIGDDAFNGCTRLTSVTIPGSVTSIGQYAFFACYSLTGVYFQGNSPSSTNDASVFGLDPATVYYLPGTTGWGAMFDGLPTAPWFLPNPLILNHSAGFGVQPGGFGFTISWATNASVVVQAATNLANPVWIPVSTNTLTGGTNYFSDPQWTNYPARYYRLQMP